MSFELFLGVPSGYLYKLLAPAFWYGIPRVLQKPNLTS